jgi:hypothetical protein
MLRHNIDVMHNEQKCWWGIVKHMPSYSG